MSSKSARASELESYLDESGLSEYRVEMSLGILRKAEEEARREGLRRAAFDFERILNAAVTTAYSVISQDGGEKPISELVLAIYAHNPRSSARHTSEQTASDGSVRVLRSRVSDPQLPPDARPSSKTGYVEADGDAI